MALNARSKYINSINALGVSLSFMPMYIQIEQDIVAIPQPNHCVSGFAFDKTKAPIIARINPSHLIPSMFLYYLIFMVA